MFVKGPQSARWPCSHNHCSHSNNPCCCLHHNQCNYIKDATGGYFMSLNWGLVRLLFWILVKRFCSNGRMDSSAMVLHEIRMFMDTGYCGNQLGSHWDITKEGHPMQNQQFPSEGKPVTGSPAEWSGCINRLLCSSTRRTHSSGRCRNQ